MICNTYSELFAGKIIKKIRGCEKHSDEMTILFEDGSYLKFYHRQDCCETVGLEDCDIIPEWLIGSKMISVEERIYRSGEGIKPLDNCAESYTWSFYAIKTSSSTMVLRWYGESNGWYSETVDIDYGYYDKNGEFKIKTINL